MLACVRGWFISSSLEVYKHPEGAVAMLVRLFFQFTAVKAEAQAFG